MTIQKLKSFMVGAISLLLLLVMVGGCQQTGEAIKIGGQKVYTAQEVNRLIADSMTNLAKRFTVRHVTYTDKDTVYGSMTCQQVCQETLTNKGEIRDITGQNCFYGALYRNDAPAVFDHDLCSRRIGDSLNELSDAVACFCG